MMHGTDSRLPPRSPRGGPAPLFNASAASPADGIRYSPQELNFDSTHFDSAVTAAPAVRPVNAFTVDVEDYFHVEALSSAITRGSWGERESRVEANTERLLGVLAERGVRGTFFVLGWVAERSPALVRRIADGGQ